MSLKPSHVTIIGGGLAAPILALALKKQGVSSTIYELRSRDWQQGGSIAAAPNCLRVLDHIGVWSRLRPQGFVYDGLTFTNGEGSYIGVFLNGDETRYGYPALRIRRRILRKELLDEVHAQGIDAFYDKRCTGIAEQDTHIDVHFADGSTIKTDFVVGADGIHSTIRQHLFPAATPTFSGMMGISGLVSKSALPQTAHEIAMPCMMYGREGFFALMPTDPAGTDVSYFSTIHYPEKTREGWDALAHDTAQLSKMLHERHCQPSWPAVVRAAIEATPPDTLVHWPFYTVPQLDSYLSASQRVVLIGDAAHAFPPTGGQGAAMAFEDAETLALTLGRAKSESASASASAEPGVGALRTWETHRRARVADVLAFTTKTGEARRASKGPWEQWVKEWAMWAFFWWKGPEGGARWIYEYDGTSAMES
ncbi:MAG: hypothetical protein M1833_002356 [Piccolia ochrophora]|nr:MAG: hypothetical protein M1833_002356 [Piccolia ochrophora]